MGKIQRRAKGGDSERKQRRHTAQPRLNRAQRKFKVKHNPVEQQQTTVGNGDEADDRTSDKTDLPATNQRKQSGGGDTAYLSAYKRAQLTYERLQTEKRAQRDRAREENERVKAERELSTRWRRKKNQALQLRTAKGQPNLNAQIGIILEQIERKANR